MSTAKTPRDVTDQVEGRNPVLEALRGRRRVYSIYVAKSVRRTGAVAMIIEEAGRAEIPVEEVDGADIRRMARTRSPQGVIAVVSPFKYSTIGELEEAVAAREKPLVVVLDGVEDPQNLGAVLRVAEASGVDGVVLGRRRCCGVTPVAVKASAGAAEHVRVVAAPNIPAILSRLKASGLWVVGAESSGGVPYFELDFDTGVAFVLGGEGQGLGRLVKERCDHLASLPMLGAVSSLNVATAGAVLLYEAIRQRSAGSERG